MSSSDSEAFESADEDVIDTKPTPAKKVEKYSNVDRVSHNVNIESTKETEPRNDPSQLPRDTKPVTGVKTADAPRTEEEEKLKKIALPAIDSSDSEREDVKDPHNVAQIEKKASEVSLTSSCELIELESVAKSLTATDAKREDDWDFEKWDDDMEDEIEELVARQPVAKAAVTQVDDKKEEKLSDEDGWQIDDWDDETSEPPKELQTSNQVNIPEKLSPSQPPPQSTESTNNWGWTPWGGMVQLISTATSHVSQVIESGIGVPNPEEIARLQHEESLKNRDQSTGETVTDSRRDDKSTMLLMGNLMSGVSLIGNRVLSGGLDTLEGIGKRTMTMLQENDPGLLNKRKMLGMMDPDTPVLSQILREAKEKTEEAEQNLKEMQKQRYKKQLHFETLFDDYHGLVHLEALEMLSQQSTMKLKALMGQLTGLALSELEETLNEVKELCELPEMDGDNDSDGLHSGNELADKLKTAVEDLDVQVDFKDTVQCWLDNIAWLESEATKSAQDIHDKALRCLAQTSAISINKMHKLAELLLIKDHHSTADEADSLVQFTSVMCWHLSGIAARFGNSLSQMDNKDEVNSLITSIFLEGSNSTSYVQNAFQLFIPILQMGAA